MGINWYDWVTPTTPGAGLFFGILFTVVIAVTIKWQMKSWKSFFVAISAGTCVSLLLIGGLSWLGFYS